MLSQEGKAVKIEGRFTAFGGSKKEGVNVLVLGCEFIPFSARLDSMYRLTEVKNRPLD